MRIRNLTLIAITLAAYQFAAADASYEHTETMNGGQLVAGLKSMSMLSKQMATLTDPISQITMVHGNQRSVVSTRTTEITDLDKEEIISIDNVKQTYTIMTFADLRKLMQQMPQREAQMQQQMKDDQAKMDQARSQTPHRNLQTSYTTSVTDPGVSKLINGKQAKEQILTMTMTVTDLDKPGSSSVLTVTNDIWTTLDIPAEIKVVDDFNTRFANKLMVGVDQQAMMADMQKQRASRSAAMSQMYGNQPGAAEAMAQMQKEMAKISGTRILEHTTMHGTGSGIAAQPAAGTTGRPPQNGGSVAGQVATDTATQTASGESSRLGIPGSALGGALMNAWNKKKAKPADSTTAPTTTATATSSGTSSADVTLMDMTSETANFSQESIPPSVFQIPDGYKQLPSPLAQMLAK